MENTKDAAVLASKLGGGPHGLGDPKDRSLRRVEIDIMIPKIMRDRARDEKCPEEVAEFTKCCKAASAFMVVKCRKETKTMRQCLEKWYQDEEFRAECSEIYLKERSDYRRTGIPMKQRKNS